MWLFDRKIYLLSHCAIIVSGQVKLTNFGQ